MRVTVRQQEFTPVVKIPPARQAYDLAASKIRVDLQAEELEQYFHGLDEALSHYGTAFRAAEPPRYRECQEGDLHNGVANMASAAEALDMVLASIEGIEPLATYDKIRGDVDGLEYQAARVFSEAFFRSCPCGGKRP